MIKKLSILLLICATEITAYSQTSKISIFAKTNYAFPSIENEPAPDVNFKPTSSSGFTQILSNIGALERKSTGSIGFDFGVNISIPLNEKFNLTSGIGVYSINYNEKSFVKSSDNSLDEMILSGTFISSVDQDLYGVIIGEVFSTNGGTLINFTSPILSTSNGNDYSLTYIKIPVTSSYKLMKKLNIYAGFDVSLLLSGKTEYDQIGLTSSSSFEVYRAIDKTGEGLNNLLVGISAGLEYSIAKKLSLIIGYGRSLSNIYKKSDNMLVPSNDYQAKNNNASIGVAYKIK